MRTILRALLVCAFTIAFGGLVIAQDKAAADKPLNLNTATLAQLEDLPGIGRATAERILEYRQKIGGFKKIEEILEVTRSARCSLAKSSSGRVQPLSRSLRKSHEISRRIANGGRVGGRGAESVGVLSCR